MLKNIIYSYIMDILITCATGFVGSNIRKNTYLTEIIV